MARSDQSEQDLRSLQGRALLSALERRARPGERPEELLLDLGIISDRDLAFQLALTSQLQFAGLRGFVPDERLFLYIPVSLAVSERICPLVMVGNSLKIASAFIDPDLSYLEQRFPNLDVELVLAARGEILAALAHIARGR
jgi:hypothetical protein